MTDQKVVELTSEQIEELWAAREFPKYNPILRFHSLDKRAENGSVSNNLWHERLTGYLLQAFSKFTLTLPSNDGFKVRLDLNEKEYLAFDVEDRINQSSALSSRIFIMRSLNFSKDSDEFDSAAIDVGKLLNRSATRVLKKLGDGVTATIYSDALEKYVRKFREKRLVSYSSQMEIELAPSDSENAEATKAWGEIFSDYVLVDGEAFEIGFALFSIGVFQFDSEDSRNLGDFSSEITRSVAIDGLGTLAEFIRIPQSDVFGKW